MFLRPTRFFTLCVIIFLAGISHSSLFSQAVFQGKPVVGISSKVLAEHFTSYQLFEIDAAALNAHVKAQPGPVPLTLALGEAYYWPMEIVPNELRADDYQLIVQTAEGEQRMPRSENKSFLGRTTLPGSGHVRLTLDTDFIYGFVEIGGIDHYIEPAWQLDPDMAVGTYLVYPETATVQREDWQCGWEGEDGHQSHEKIAPAPQMERSFMQCFQVEVALAADFSMFSSFGSVAATENWMLGVLNNVQSNYDNEFNNEIQFVVVANFVSTCSSCDPWSSTTSAGSLLDSFTSWGNSGGFGVAHDLASLWTNRNLNGSTIGVAWVGGLCSNLEYNVLQRFTTDANLLRVLQAHEFGHNFNAGHDAPGSPFIMAPSVNNTNQWSGASTSTINNYINAKSGQPGCFSACNGGGSPPVADITAPVTQVCPGGFVPFIDNSQNDPISWSWSFQGGIPSSSTQQNPIVQYPNPGVYFVSLEVTNAFGTDFTVLTTDIVVEDNGTKYLLYETFEEGLGNWQVLNPDFAKSWDIKDIGGAQYGKRAAWMDNYTYNNPGQLDALVSPTLSFAGETTPTLQVDYAYSRYNASRNDQLNIYVSIDGGATYPFLVYSGLETGGGNFATAPDQTTPFTPNTQSDWCFGGGFGANCLTISLSSYAGQPNVKIKIENVNGHGNGLYIDNVRVSADCIPLTPPEPDFTSDIAMGCLPLEVNFLDLTTGQVDNLFWEFPGGQPSTSTDPFPTVVYNIPGTYDVILTATNGAGSETLILEDYITVLHVPEPDFFFSTAGLTVYVDDLSQNADMIEWDFGDGNSGTGQSTTYTYAAPGTYPVTLTASNSCGEASTTQMVTVEQPISAAFAADTLQGCPGLVVTFNSDASGDATTWQWSFPGGSPSSSSLPNPVVTYDTPGLYDVSLMVGNNDGITDTIVQSDYIFIDSAPEAAFAIGYTTGQNSIATTNNSANADTYAWDFGDGSTSSEQQPGHTYAADGTYTVTLIATNACGNDTTTQQVTIITPPSAGFSASASQGCAPFTVQITDQSSSNTTQWQWTATGATPQASTMQNPSFTFDSPGTYSIILLATNPAGTDADTLQITVLAGPEAAFAIGYTTGQNSIATTNNSANADTYAWDFGDGSTSSEQQPGHTYAADGTYTVTLIATNACGNDTTTQQVTIITPPSAGFSASASQGCAPFTVQITDQSSSNTTQWQWTATGATPQASTMQNPSFTFDSPGTYSIILLATNPAGTDADTLQITVLAGPEAAFAIGYTTGQNSIATTNNSANADTYAWDFGDGSTSSEQQPGHTYAADGTYTVTLIATNACGNDTTTQQVTIITPPSAGFSASATQGCAPFTVQLTDQSSSNTTQWQWTATGATPQTSTMQNPSFTFDSPGTYSIILLATNPAGTDADTLQITVLAGPEAAFAIGYATGQNSIATTNNSQNAESYSWDFGDGSTSSEQQPGHTYAADGTYTVTLIATNACGNDTTTQQVTIISPPAAAFSASATQGCAPFTVQLTDQSSSNTTQWQWTATGATPQTSTMQNPSFTFDSPGTYSIILLATNPAGADADTLQITVLAGPEAAFAIGYTTGQNSIATTNSSQNAESYSWDFGDGSTSSEQQPEHTYAADGTYTVTLVATNACGNDTTTQQVTIITPPAAAFSASATQGCAPFTVQLTDQSSSNTTQWQWTATGATPQTSTVQNPSFTFDSPGTYSIILLATNPAGADADTLQITVLAGPEAAFAIGYTTGQNSIATTNSSQNAESYSWDFGDGSTSSEQQPGHTYAADGTYTVTLIATNACGNDTTTQQVTIITPPAAAFSASATQGCAPFTVQLTDQSSSNTTQWQWTATGATPQTSTMQNPSFTFDSPGTYSIILLATNPAGADADTIQVTTLAGPEADFEYAVNGVNVQFINTSVDGTTYSWDFGDGNTSMQANPNHAYTSTGTFPVTLSVTNECGTDSFLDSVTIDLAFPVANFTLTNNEGCAPLEVQFTNTSQNAESYAWVFSGGTPATSTEANPTVTYSTPGIYTVSLTAINPAGSGAVSKMNVIVVGGPPEAGFEFSVDAANVSFTNTTMNGDAFLWLFGDGGSSMEESPEHTFPGAGSFEVLLITENNCGLDTASQTILITGEAPMPALAASVNSGCAPLTVSFTGSYQGGEPENWSWIFPGGEPSSSAEQNPVVVYQEAGSYGVNLSVSNAFGQNAVFADDLIVVQEEPTAYFSASTQELQLTVDSVATGPGWAYEWDFGDGSGSSVASPSHTYAEEGAYLVSLTVSNECGQAVAQQEVTIVSSSTYAAAWEGTIDVFPNPNRGHFTVVISGQPGETLRAGLLSIVGQELYHQEVDFHSGYWRQGLSFDHLPPGVYILRLQADGQAAYRKVVIE